MSAKVWFITGVSRGFGRLWATAALERGDKVAATARDISTLDDLQRRFGDALLPLTLDVTDRDQAFACVAKAHNHFGRIDVVINNAGYGQFGFIEEFSESEARDQMDANFFGVLWVTQAALPLLRAQGSGHIIQVSSVAGLFSSSDVALYCASKFALEGLTEGLAAEVQPFGVHVTLIEPGLFATDWAGSSARRATPISDYAQGHDDAAATLAQVLGAPSDPATTVSDLLNVVDAPKPPLRVIFGPQMLPVVEQFHQERVRTWKQSQPA